VQDLEKQMNGNGLPTTLLARATVWLRRMQVMTVKEFLQLFRDTIVLCFMAYVFTADVYLAGSGVNLELKNAAIVVHDADHSTASRELSYRFRLPYFKPDGEIARAEQGMRLLDQGTEMLVLSIPPQFQQDLENGRPTAVQLQVDSSNSVLGLLAAGYGARIVGEFGLEAALLRTGVASSGADNLPVVQDEHRVWFNPNQNDTWFMSISELLTDITLFAIFLPGAAMVREKERGTVEQLLVSPLTPFQIVFPKMLAMTAVILAGTALSLFLILKSVFQVPMHGSLLLFFAVTTLYVFTTAGLGMFIATLARNMAQVGMLTVLVFLPMIFLSGAWTPPEAMTYWMRGLMYISPLHYFLDASFGILLKGAGLGTLWDSVLVIALIGSINFGLGMWRFRRQFQ
jgi:ABC-2 type transport system permease protein